MPEISIERALLNILADLKKNQRKLESSRRIAFSILEDVSEEKKKAEEEKEKVTTILKSAGDGIFAVDINREIVLFNPMAEKISGFKQEEAIGKYCCDVIKFTNKDGTLDFCEKGCPVERTFKTKEIISLPKDIFLVAKSGTRVAIAVIVAPVKNQKGEVIGSIVNFRDVTKEREVDEMKTMFVSISSHQLRTPLSAIRWYSEMLLSGDAGKLNESQRDYLTQIYESNMRMIALVNDLLDISRIEEGRIKMNPQLIQLEELVDSLIREFQPISKARNVKLSFLKTEKPLPKVYADPLKIRQVIQNLIANAINYNKPKGKVEVSFKKEKNQIVFICEDAGMGIPKNEQPKMFNQFFRGSNTMVREVEGTGLGLYISKSIIESSGGKIWLESEENKGTKFYFTLPLNTE